MLYSTLSVFILISQNSEIPDSHGKPVVRDITKKLNERNARSPNDKSESTQPRPAIQRYSHYTLQSVRENADFNYQSLKRIGLNDDNLEDQAFQFVQGEFKAWRFLSTVEFVRDDGSTREVRYVLILKTDQKDKILESYHYEWDEWASPPLVGLLCYSRPTNLYLRDGLKIREFEFQHSDERSSICKRRFQLEHFTERVLSMRNSN